MSVQFPPHSTERCPGAAYDVLFHHHGAEIVCAISERDLANPRACVTQELLHVFDVVEKSAPALRPQYSDIRSAVSPEHGMLRLKGPANECRKPAAAILLITNAPQCSIRSAIVSTWPNIIVHSISIQARVQPASPLAIDRC